MSRMNFLRLSFVFRIIFVSDGRNVYWSIGSANLGGFSHQYGFGLCFRSSESLVVQLRCNFSLDVPLLKRCSLDCSTILVYLSELVPVCRIHLSLRKWGADFVWSWLSLKWSYIDKLLKPLRCAILVSSVFRLSKFAHTGSVRWRKNGEHVPSPSVLGSFLLDICFLSKVWDLARV
jgi:hypothetical protein